MRASSLRRITIVLAALMVSACAGLRPESDPMAFARSPSAPASPALDASLPFTVNFDAALQQAQDLRKKGELREAARVLGQLVIAAPNDARVIGEYGKVMLESGSTDDAVAFLERAVALKGTDWTLFSALGIAYDQSGNREAARASFNHALALKPGEPAILSNLALSHIQAGELDDAERLLLQASEQEKDVPGLADKLAMVRSLKGSTPATAMQTPVAAPPPIEPATPSAEDTVDQEPAIPEELETEMVAAAAENPVIATAPPSSPAKTIEPDPQAPARTATASPNSVRPLPKVAAARRTPVSTRSPPGQPKTARAVSHPIIVATAAPVQSPRPAGVTRAMTRTATIPLVVTAPPDSWEAMVRVSLPSPSVAVPKPDAAAPPAASAPAPEPSGWFAALTRWASSVLGLIGRIWA